MSSCVLCVPDSVEQYETGRMITETFFLQVFPIIAQLKSCNISK